MLSCVILSYIKSCHVISSHVVLQGNLCPKTSSLTHTLLSRLRLLWHHVHESRAAFENSADKGVYCCIVGLSLIYMRQSSIIVSVCQVLL